MQQLANQNSSVQSDTNFLSDSFLRPKVAKFKKLRWGKARFDVGDKVKLSNESRSRNYPEHMERKIFIISKTVNIPGLMLKCTCGTANTNRHLPLCGHQFSHPQNIFLTDLDGELVYEVDDKGRCLNGRFYGGDFVWVKDKAKRR